MKKIFLLFLTAVLLISCAPQKYAMKYDAGYFKGKNNQDVYEIFTSEGFKNVELVIDENAMKFPWSKNGEVTEVSVAGKTDFKRNDGVNKEDKVVIRYIEKK